MAKKCVHKGCQKTYQDDNEECVYHPGPPVFHEGQKGKQPASSAPPKLLAAPNADANPPTQAGNVASPAFSPSTSSSPSLPAQPAHTQT